MINDLSFIERLQSTVEVYLKDLSQAQDLQSPERSNESLIFVRDQTYLSLSSGCLEVYKELISISLLDSDFLLPSIKFQVGRLQNCASSHGMNLGSCGEELCMLTERAIEEPNLRRSAEMNHCASFFNRAVNLS
ncbi:hypothetical protein DY000_02030279 [Brassica cretica]|uniref:Uncharacterized protein n=1 Tax=Brassica cretica TaxID=69181 RepID=A0ABQ7DDV5_BRACR|nr:hypothetical protein DY000_02030279 [Brassica cretica]